ncbi:hypothetical protein Syun_015078 [Stephania yunnanensis]|uniref:Uncharacterized protein n=1 Tax=Stephania yunnanensis TaxID=152371 RepID=A0AAP0JKI7_9MAGN
MDETTVTSKSATTDDAVQIDQNNNANIVDVNIDTLQAVAAEPIGEVVSDNDEFKTNANDDEEDCSNEDDELTSSSNSGSEDELD